MVICSKCGRDIDAIGQDNMSYDMNPVCEDCATRSRIIKGVSDMTSFEDERAIESYERRAEIENEPEEIEYEEPKTECKLVEELKRIIAGSEAAKEELRRKKEEEEETMKRLTQAENGLREALHSFGVSALAATNAMEDLAKSAKKNRG